MRILAVILGTFLALFGVFFGGCAIAWTIAVLWQGMPDAGIVWLVVVNIALAASLLRAAYRLFRGPVRPPDSLADEPGS
jgi:hypothetical protein